jgi:DNA-binding Xre family transcriptional regulator
MAHDPSGDSDASARASEQDLARWRQEVGDRIRSVRSGVRVAGRRVSQDMLAKGIGMQRSDLSLIENGRDMRMSTLFKIATFLGVAASELLPPDHQPPE